MPPQPLEVSHPHPPYLKDFLGFLPELNKESERGRVLISCSYLDELMRLILLAFLVDNDSSKKLIEGFNAPLGTLSTRSSAAFALGLISEQEFKECNTLRKVRNLFAHRVHASFDTQEIRDLCNNLTMAVPSSDKVIVDACGQYTSAVVALIIYLNNRPVYVARKRRNVEKWPR
ncbi:MAG: transcriptional regulator [Vampirovibrio sp.]|nr:transcriptional regulator [Vampirovibrio sp.]